MLEIYLRRLGYKDLGFDPRELFYDLEEKQVTSIELYAAPVVRSADARPISITDIGTSAVISLTIGNLLGCYARWRSAEFSSR
jgi:hypothetical protein